MSENLSEQMAATFSENEDLKVKLQSMTRQRDRLLAALSAEADSASLPNHWQIIASKSQQEITELKSNLVIHHTAISRLRFACGKLVHILGSNLTGEALYAGVTSAVIEAKEALEKTSKEFPLYATGSSKSEGFPISFVP